MEDKRTKGEIIADSLIRMSGVIIVCGILVKIDTISLTGMVIFLVGEAYRFYHFRKYKSDNLRVIAALVICLAIGLINKYFQLF